MNRKTTLEIYTGHGDGFSDRDLEELGSALTELTGKEIIVKDNTTADGTGLLFIVEQIV